MPTPRDIVTAAAVVEEIGLGSEALNLLGVVGKGAGTAAKAASTVEGLAAVGAKVEGTVALGSKLEGTLGLGGNAVGESFSFPGIVQMEQRFAAVRIPSIVLRNGAPSIQPVVFDTADDLGRAYTLGKTPLAAIAKVPLNPAEPISYGSGVAVRADGLIVAARHTVREGARGNIWVRLINQPGGSFRVGILDESAAEDLVLLKPLTPIGRTVSHLPVTNFADNVGRNSKLVTVGVQNAVADSATGIRTGELHLSQGSLIDRVPMRFPGEAPIERYRTTIVGEYGLSGGGTYELRSNKFVGSMLGGSDYKWSGLAPADKIRSMIIRNLHR